jgi:arylsulfatase
MQAFKMIPVKLAPGLSRRSAFLLVLMVSACAPMPKTIRAPSSAANRPNIVLVVLDDTGYSDLGAFGSEIRTPNIDRLAAEGLRYTRFDSKAVCSPTRAALLTGRNSHTVRMGDLTASERGQDLSAYRGEMPRNVETVAEALKRSGYSTHAVGKWHLAPDYEDGKPGNNASWPLQRGFQTFYGFLGGWADQYRPDLAEGNRTIGKPTDPGYHFSSAIVDQAIGATRSEGSRPFFMYLNFGATHAPIQVPKAYIDRYAGLYEQGWDAIREARLGRMKRMGIIPANTVLPSINPGDRPWAKLSAVERRVYARFMATYAGFLEHADEQLGRFVAHLKRTGAFENTLFVVVSDNGAAAEAGQTGSFGKLYPPNQMTGEEIAPRVGELGQIHAQYQRPWAMASVTPFRRYKSWPNAGGVRAPLIVSWQRGISERGAIRSQFVDAIDIAPTLLDIGGASFAERVGPEAQIPVAGRSMRATFASAATPSPRNVQFFELRGNRAIRSGDWRAVAIHKLGTPFSADRWELYNLAVDFSESSNVAAKYPAKLAELQALWQREAKRHGVLPLTEGPAYVQRLNRYRDASLENRH